MRRYVIAMIVLAVISAASVAANHFARQGPLADRKTEEDIRRLQTAIQLFADKEYRIPDRIEELSPKEKLNGQLSQYEYRNLGRGPGNRKYEYELCATFRTDTLKGEPGSDDYDDIYLDASKHRKGRHCFKSTEFITRPGYSTEDYYDYPDGKATPEPSPVDRY